jgi:hypothetical protein
MLYGLFLSVGSLILVIGAFELVGLGLYQKKNKD